MKVNFYATFRNTTGVRSIDVPVENNDTVEKIIQKVFLLFPQLIPHWCDSEGKFHAHLTIILNKVDITSLENGLQSQVTFEDELDFVPPVGGGSGLPGKS